MPNRARRSTRFLAVVLTLVALAAIAAPASAQPPGPGTEPPDVFGMTTTKRPLDDPAGGPSRDLILDRTRDSGATSVRYGNLDWATVEATEGVIDMTKLAAIEKDLAGLSAGASRPR